MTAEARLLAALDSFRDALAEYVADRRTGPPTTAALVTLTDAARSLGIARSTATRWADRGELPTRVIDGRRWVARADLDRLATS
jgi:D-alanyl-D-alanine carboxypeptidase